MGGNRQITEIANHLSMSPLDIYMDILQRKRGPRYLQTKRYRVDFDTSDSDRELWAIHRDAVESLGEGNDGEGKRSLLDLKVELGGRMMRSCRLCERRCDVDRLAGERGYCGSLVPRVACEQLHYGEEDVLVPSYTIFFSGCNFKCVYCQNWDIATNPGLGRHYRPEEIALKVEDQFLRGGRGVPSNDRVHRVRNVNWVGGEPTPAIPFILEVLRSTEVPVPQVFNSNMYLTEEAMALLDGVVDVWLTDLKYGNDLCAIRLSDAPDYLSIVHRNHLLAMGSGEVLVRHLVLPNHLLCCTFPVLEWVAENLPGAAVNVMGQYRPTHRAFEHQDIARPLRRAEYEAALAKAVELDLCLVN